MNRNEIRRRIIDGACLETDIVEKTDVAVIGSGPGGAAAAALLSEAGLDVVVCEEGGYFDQADFTHNFLDAIFNLYRNNSVTGVIGHPPILIPEGQCVGGTSVINSGTCFRTPDYILQTWRLADGVEDISPTIMAPIFDEVEKRNSVEELSREIWGPNALAVERGARELGLSFKPMLHNAVDCRGCGTCTFGCTDGAKQTPDIVYLPAVLQRGGRIYSRAKVKRISMHCGRASGFEGVFCDTHGKETPRRFRIEAKIVVLAAGTLNTPVLLKVSKLGLESGQVGRNLSIHPATRVLAQFDEDISGWNGVPQGTYIDDFAKDGILLEGIFVPPSVSAIGLPYNGAALKDAFMKDFKNISMYGVMISDTSRGVVWNRRGRHMGMYQMNKLDSTRMLRGIQILCEIYRAAGAKRIFPGVGTIKEIPLNRIGELANRKAKSSDFKLMAFHPLGSCRMGPDPATSVTDSWGEVHAAPGLFITDGSTAPSPVGVNPQITILALAHRAARHILNEKMRYF